MRRSGGGGARVGVVAGHDKKQLSRNCYLEMTETCSISAGRAA